jgi:hypothetical protein
MDYKDKPCNDGWEFVASIKFIHRLVIEIDLPLNSLNIPHRGHT